jgi:hypothetical protein
VLDSHRLSIGFQRDPVPLIQDVSSAVLRSELTTQKFVKKYKNKSRVFKKIYKNITNTNISVRVVLFRAGAKRTSRERTGAAAAKIDAENAFGTKSVEQLNEKTVGENVLTDFRCFVTMRLGASPIFFSFPPLCLSYASPHSVLLHEHNNSFSSWLRLLLFFPSSRIN